MSSDNFSVESGLFTAASIATVPCQTERVTSYEEKIPDYQGRDFTYMPMPYNEKYYNTEEGWIRDLHPDQYLREDTHLIDTLKKLQQYPFLLLDYRISARIQLYEGNVVLPKSTAEEYSLEYDRLVTYADIPELDQDEIGDVPDLDGGLFTLVLANDNDSVERTNMQEIRSGDDEELLNAVNDILYTVGAGERFGIITLPDLNRRPMKEMIYRALSELEITISKNIEQEYEDSRTLFKPAHPPTIGRWEKDQLDDLGLHIAEYMNLIELQECLKMSDSNLITRCGFESKSDVDDLGSINSLRNKVMHSNRTLVHNRRDIERLLENLYRIEEIVNNASAVEYW
jgi:hypothetical protein